MEIFGAICLADQLEIILGGIVHAETATVRCLMIAFSANQPTSSR